MKIITFAYGDLTFRTFVREDIAEVFPLIKDNWELTQYMLWDPPSEIGETYAAHDRRPHKPYGFAVRRGGVIIGRASIREVDHGAGSADIGYWVHQSAQRQGLGTELIKGLTQYITQRMGLRKITAQTFLGNIASQKALAKAGFRQVKRLTNAVEKNGEMLDEYLYEYERFALWPAIDLLGGDVVRLRQGDYAQVSTYTTAVPTLVAELSTFAGGIHVVDLDGAKAGKRVNTAVIEQIVEHATVPVELGGGIRTLADARETLALGVSRVIYGSAAVQNPTVVEQALQELGPAQVVLGVDARDGRVATHGWESDSGVMVDELIERFVPWGLRTVISTDIATDGMLQGPNLPSLRALQGKFSQLRVIASGGVASVGDIRATQAAGLAGVIFGKAYYEGRLPLRELQNYYTPPA